MSWVCRYGQAGDGTGDPRLSRKRMVGPEGFELSNSKVQNQNNPLTRLGNLVEPLGIELTT